MTDEAELRDKLRKIEALFAGAGTPGEKAAAGAAAERIRERLREAGVREAAIEVRYAIADPWSRKLFLALCRRYGLKPFRYPRMHRQSVVVRAPRSFLEEVLRPEFDDLNAALTGYLVEVTDRVIRQSVFADTTEAEERPEPKPIGR